MSPMKKEPMADTNDQLVRDMMLHDAERMSHPDAVVNRLVYDSHDCPSASPSLGGPSNPRPGPSRT